MKLVGCTKGSLGKVVLKLKIYLSYYYDFELQCHLGAQKVHSLPQEQQHHQLGPLLDLMAIASKKEMEEKRINRKKMQKCFKCAKRHINFMLSPLVLIPVLGANYGAHGLLILHKIKGNSNLFLGKLFYPI